MQDNDNSIATPNNVYEVEQLIKRLYDPRGSSSVTQIDDQLKRLQLSSEGWQLADTLLGSEDANVRFFGALTFQVKLNNDGARLEPAVAQSILLRILSWTLRVDAAGEGPLVRKKLCAALATYVLQSSALWDQPVLHLAVLFRQGIEALDNPERIIASRDALPSMLQSLSESQLVVLLWLCSSLATDAYKIDNSNAASARSHDQMEAIVEHATSVMYHIIQRNDLPDAAKLQSEVLLCFLNWVNYAQPMWPAKQDALQYLRNLIEPLAPLLIDDALQAEATDVFREILESYTSFFQTSHMQLFARIIHQHVKPRLLKGLQTQDPDLLPIAQFVIAYGLANIERVVEHPDDESGSQCIVDLHLAFLRTPGYPGEEDEISVLCIEFWDKYAEHVNDEMHNGDGSGEKPAWLENAKTVCRQLTSLIWAKLKTPPAAVAQAWTEAESDAFKDFRMDASDLLLSIYLPLGKEVLRQFIDTILEALREKNWQSVEAAAFCINVLADNVMEDPGAEELLREVFGSTLFRDVADFTQPIPSQTRRTAIDMLGAYGQYIERHAEFLPDALRFLFASLENTGLHISAAKSISALCSTCRASLTGELPGFLDQYNRFAASSASEPYTNEKVIGAIAAIVQACTPDNAKVSPLLALLNIIDQMIASSAQIARSGDTEKAHTQGVSALECLTSIGKGLQEPEDTLVDLYNDSDEPPTENFWNGEHGQLLRDRILKACQSVMQLYPNSGEVVDAVCNVLSSGFVETKPGPFVFPPDTIIAFIEQCNPTTPHVESVLSMACRFIMQYSRASSPLITPSITRIYTHILAFIRALQTPRQDPSVANSCLEILTRMLNRYSSVVLDMPSPLGPTVETILTFALQGLEGPDLLPKRTSAELWSKLVRLTPTTHPSLSHSSPDAPLHARTQQVLAAYGPLLAAALIRQICGNAQRSELGELCEPLRALIQTQPRTRMWLEAALQDTIPSASGMAAAAVEGSSAGVSDAEKRRFVQALCSLRGESHKTREVVKNFYAACRGTVSSFV